MTFPANGNSGGLIRSLLAVSALALLGGHAQADTDTLSLNGYVTNFVTGGYCGALCQDFYLPLSGLTSDDSVTVQQGDTVDVSVTLDNPVTLPTSTDHTNILLYLTGSSFPSENTGVNGTFTFYSGGLDGAAVETFDYSSTTSNQLSSYATYWPPGNTFTFDSFTDDFTINTLGTPATLDGSAFDYQLVSQAPEPSTWAMLMLGFAGLGFAGYRRTRPRFA